MITQARLKELLHYNPDTGVFTWLLRAGQRIRVGGIAGNLDAGGYRRIMIEGRRYLEHRLVWLYMTGAWPVDQMDHISGVRDDNRLVNLREATNRENCQNRALDVRNTSGFTGVSWNKRDRKWQCLICVEGRNKSLGYFNTPEEAHAAYVAAKAMIHTFNPVPRYARDVPVNRGFV